MTNSSNKIGSNSDFNIISIPSLLEKSNSGERGCAPFPPKPPFDALILRGHILCLFDISGLLRSGNRCILLCLLLFSNILRHTQ